MSNGTEQFRAAIQAAGLTPPEVIAADGKLHRFASNGKRTDHAGWYRLHDGPVPTGAFGDWRTGVSETWRADIGRSLTPEENAAHRERIEKIRREQEAEKARAQDEAAKRAVAIWNAAQPVADHPYLKLKGIKAHGVRLYDQALVVPMLDAGGALHSLQFIAQDGDKRFLPRGRVSGCYFPIGKPGATLCIAEGYATAATLHEATGLPVAVAFHAGNLLTVARALRKKFPEARLTMCADDDAGTEGNPGITKATEAAQAVGGLLAVPDFGEGRPEGVSDFNDLARLRGPDTVRAAIESAESVGASAGDSIGWRDPEPLPEHPAVAPFDYSHLPPVLRAYVRDIAERMQCPPDFVAVACVAMIGAAIGRKVGIRPKRVDDWTVIANLWAMTVGRSGVMKSPALSEALAALRRMQADAFREHEEALKAFETDSKLQKMSVAAAEKRAAKLMEKGRADAAALELGNAQSSAKDEPVARRYIINDSTVEALAETLEENPNGVLVDRDELSGWLRSLDKEGQQEARAFYLTAADGDKGFTTDRIGRGRGRHIEAVCVSIVGGIQPGVLGGYVRETQRGGAGDDGLLQRFGLMVYPDVSAKWENVDRPADHEARAAIHGLVSRLCNLTPQDIGAETDPFKPIPFLHFTADAQGMFDDWRAELEVRIRSTDEHPAVVSHLAKYRKLIPGLALINHLCEGGTGAVSETALARAVQFSEYLETHARRVYSYASRPDLAAAKTIIGKLKAGKIKPVFKLREVYHCGWSGLTTPEETRAAMRLLVDYGHVREIETRPDSVGGRPSEGFEAHSSIRGRA